MNVIDPQAVHQRFIVRHPRLGPWAAGAVLQADADLAGANLLLLIDTGAVELTDQPRDVKIREEK
jgi:hypothetical protein